MTAWPPALAPTFAASRIGPRIRRLPHWSPAFAAPLANSGVAFLKIGSPPYIPQLKNGLFCCIKSIFHALNILDMKPITATLKAFLVMIFLTSLTFLSFRLAAQTPQPSNQMTQPSQSTAQDSTQLYIDVHHLGAGKVTASAVAAAHQKDLAVEKKYNVRFIKYWVDVDKGDVYCLSSASDPAAIRATHAEAHGLPPDDIYKVTAGQEAMISGNNNLYLDIHELGPGNVTAAAVAAAHQKDLAVQKKYGVNFINYWVDEKNGIVMCLSQAPDSTAVINTHREAHGLLPVAVVKVEQGQ